MNTIQVIYQASKRKENFSQKAILMGFNLFVATVMGWGVLFLIYEISCFIGKTTTIDSSIIRSALRADKQVTMKYRTQSFAVNKLIHELEEMKVFYSQI